VDLVAFFKHHKEQAFARGHAKPEDPVFASRVGTPLSHRNVQRRGFGPARERAKIEGVTFHSLRHAFASRMIDGGVNPVQLAHVMGHEDARITLASYANLYDQAGTDEVVRTTMMQ
jgi:integrase